WTTMGVQGVFPFLKEKGIEGIEVDTRTIAQHIHVDVLGLFRAYIVSTETSIKCRLDKMESHTPCSIQSLNPPVTISPATNSLSYANWQLCNAVEGRISKLFLKGKVTLHFDGSALTIQKTVARQERTTQANIRLQKALTLVGNVTSILNYHLNRSLGQKVVKRSNQALNYWIGIITMDCPG
ncbi:hypothetical protein BGZ76_003692, partial [Entomortierella beljakovae]